MPVGTPWLFIRGRRTGKHFPCLMTGMRLMSNSTQGEQGLEWSLTPAFYSTGLVFVGCCRDQMSSVQLSHESTVILVIHISTARMEHEQPSKLQDSVTCPQQVLSHWRIRSVKGGEDTTCGTALSCVPVCWSRLSASHRMHSERLLLLPELLYF